MAEPHDELKTVRLGADEIREIAAEHDGRFGESFDDELHVPSVLYVMIGVVVVTALGFVIAWAFYAWIFERPAAPPTSVPVVARKVGPRLPSGPLLQSSPEEELKELQAEMHQLVHTYGWVDEGQEIVRVPLDRAIDLVLEQGLAAQPAPPEEEAVTP